MNPAQPEPLEATTGEQRRLLAALTPQARLKMTAAMWVDGKRLVEASLRAQGVSDPMTLRVRTFRRIYASDFDAATMDRIVEQLRLHTKLKFRAVDSN
ncbi:MAG: hypothetical protein NTV05_18705 [Acidobacteria bacterium]|nr:hypothetical protein [Acidobacteriota bacterium]